MKTTNYLIGSWFVLIGFLQIIGKLQVNNISSGFAIVILGLIVSGLFDNKKINKNKK